MKILRNVLIAAMAAGFVSATAFAQDADLALTATGTISAAPEWQDNTNSPITNVNLDFTAFAGTTAAADVDSATVDVKIIDSTESGNAVNITLTRPTTCTIGSNSVTDANVHFMDGGTARTADGTISFTEGSLKAVGLRFAAAGNHGTQTGAVSCTGAGQLRYSY